MVLVDQIKYLVAIESRKRRANKQPEIIKIEYEDVTIEDREVEEQWIGQSQ
jgi:hypothetical protein